VDAIRISVGFFNTASEIARFCAAVEDLARYTPETIPARRMLTVLGQGDG
jgi:cysteine sulfinate desulfinase/cysteine desulfurase-like protein